MNKANELLFCKSENPPPGFINRTKPGNDFLRYETIRKWHFGLKQTVLQTHHFHRHNNYKYAVSLSTMSESICALPRSSLCIL